MCRWEHTCYTTIQGFGDASWADTVLPPLESSWFSADYDCKSVQSLPLEAWEPLGWFSGQRRLLCSRVV